MGTNTHTTRIGRGNFRELERQPRRYRISDLEGCSQTQFLRAILEAHGWLPTDSDDWHFFWSFELHDRAVFSTLTERRWVNHFPGIAPIVLKDELHYYLAAAARRMARRGVVGCLDFFPRSYSMPEGFSAFIEDASARPDTVWLLKPKRLSAGRGIELITDLAQVNQGEEWMVQEYVANPLLLPGHPYKHVLRVYVLLTSLDPLVLYIHSVGSVRYTSRPYSASREALSDPVVHFINGYLQKACSDTPIWTEDFETYRGRLRACGIDDAVLWHEIRRMAILTAIVFREHILGASLVRTMRLQGCFELLGLDVLIDDDLKPWLIECNMSPAVDLSAPVGTPDREAQQRTREPVVHDMLRLLGIVGSRARSLPADSGLERFHAELESRGGFERAFPGPDARTFLPFFQIPRPADLVLISEA